MAELGVQPPTGLYPQPPAPPSQGALSDPTRLIDLFGAITRNQMLQNELKARSAIGQAYQGALNPDGTLDPQKLRSGLTDPNANWMLPEATSQVQSTLGAQSDRLVKQGQYIYDSLGSLADKPNLSREDINNWVTTASRVGGIPPATLEAIKSTMPAGKASSNALRNWLQTARSAAIGSSGLARRETGPVGPSGEQSTVSTGQTIFGGAGGGGGRPLVTGQPPGEAESQAAAAAGASSLEATGPKTAQIHADLENLRQLNKDIPIQGPTAEFEKKLNQVGARLGIGVTMTAQQLAKAEEFDKIANQLSLNQSTLFHGSDAGLHTVVAANPSLGQSRYGREGVIDMLQGNQDAVDRMRGVWLAARRAGAPASSFNQFVDRISKDIDPRVFQFNRMSRDNQQKFLEDMDEKDLPEFERKYRDAISKGWVQPLKKGNVRIDIHPSPENIGKRSQAEPPVPGARMAADGHWYVRQPHANGDYQRVVMNA